MTEETKKLFDAPWAVDEEPSKNFGEVFDVMDEDLYFHYARCYDEKTANRISHLPELYDALMEATKEYCKGADLGCPEKRCALAMDHMCKALPWLELLRKVRDGK